MRKFLRLFVLESVLPILRILGLLVSLAVGYSFGGFFTAFLFGLCYHVVTKPIED